MLDKETYSASSHARAHADRADPLLARAAGFREAPGFPEAVRVFAESMANFRLHGPKLINKLLGQDVRFRIVCFTLYLHYEDAEGEVDAGATYSRVLDLISRTVGGGHRVVETTLDLMSVMGLVVAERGTVDRRLKLYRPTDPLMRLLRIWLEGCFVPLDLVDPEGGRMARLRQGDEIVRQFMLGVGRGLRAREILTRRMPRFSCFFDSDGGWPFLAIIMAEALAGRPLPSRSEIASRFGVSKSQIAVVATEAARLGFLQADERGVWVTPDLMSEFERWVSINLAFFAAATEPAI